MTETLLLTVLVVVLILLRQNLVVVLGVAAFYVSRVFGEEPLRFVILDAWHALNKDILLSIPLFLLAGQIMTRGSMAERLVRLSGPPARLYRAAWPWRRCSPAPCLPPFPDRPR